MTGAPVSPHRFTAIRVLVGLWVVWLAGNGLGWGAFQGMDRMVVGLAGLSGLLLMLGRGRRWAAALILAAWWWVPGFHPLGWDGAGGLILLMLLPFLAAEPGEPWVLGRRRALAGWQVPTGPWQASRQLWMVTLVLHGVALLGSPGWRSGAILTGLSETPLMGTVGGWLLGRIPDVFFPGLAIGWGILLVLGPALFWMRRTERQGYLLVLVTVTLFALFYAGSELVWVTVLLTWMGFDGRWLPGRKEGKGGDLVLFDGVCPLCHGTVEFVLDEDPSGDLRFAPLQGETAQRLLGASVKEMKSVIYVRGMGEPVPELARESDAVLAIWEHLGGLWRVLACARWIPRGWRNMVYQWIARNRYRWFGQMAACPLPPQEVRHRFLP